MVDNAIAHDSQQKASRKNINFLNILSLYPIGWDKPYPIRPTWIISTRFLYYHDEVRFFYLQVGIPKALGNVYLIRVIDKYANYYPRDVVCYLRLKFCEN